MLIDQQSKAQAGFPLSKFDCTNIVETTIRQRDWWSKTFAISPANQGGARRCETKIILQRTEFFSAEYEIETAYRFIKDK